MAGNAQGVNPDTPVALRYQVDRSASRAKFGETRLSTWPLEFSSELSGNSSRRLIHSGGWQLAAAAGARPAGTSADAGRTSWEVGDTSRKTRAKTSGAGARERRHSRIHCCLLYSTAARTPPA